MAREISNGTHTVKLYKSRRMHQLAYYEAGKRKLKNFSVKSEVETVAWRILGQLTNGTEEARAFKTSELENLVACGNWAEGRDYLVKGGSPFPAMMRHREMKAPVAIFIPDNIRPVRFNVRSVGRNRVSDTKSALIRI